MRVFEAASTLSPVGAGILVPANAMNILEHYGLAGQVRGEGVPIEWFLVLDRHGRVISKLSANYTQNVASNNGATMGSDAMLFT